MSEPALLEIDDRTWRVGSELGGRDVFQYLIAGGDDVLLVDTGVASTPREVIAPALRRLGLAPERLTMALVTHPDVDHQGGLAAVLEHCPHAVAACGFYDRPLVQDPERLLADRYEAYAREHGLGSDVAAVRWTRAHAGARVDVAVTFSGGEELRLGDRRLEVLHAPGHSAGHLVLHEPATGLLFSSDAIHWTGCPGVDGSRALCPTYEEVDAYLGSIALVRRLAPREVHSGHWPVRRAGEVPAWLDESRDWVERVDAVVRERLAEGPATLAELCLTVDGRCGPWESEPRMLAFVLHGHLRRLVRAGAVSVLNPVQTPLRYAVDRSSVERYSRAPGEFGEARSVPSTLE